MEIFWENLIREGEIRHLLLPVLNWAVGMKRAGRRIPPNWRDFFFFFFFFFIDFLHKVLGKRTNQLELFVC